MEASLDAFKFRFTKCKKKVAKAFPALDRGNITDLEPEEEAEGEEDWEREEANEGVKAKAKPIGVEEVIETSKVDLTPILEEMVVDLED